MTTPRAGDGVPAQAYLHAHVKVDHDPRMARIPAAVPRNAASEAPERPLLRIQAVAAETGLTARSIRYYEELGLLTPAVRSPGDYRLYDPSDLERLRFIRELRDDAGFSLAEIGLLLEDEAARIRDAERFRAAGEADERKRILRGLLERVDRQVATLEAKSARLRAMIDEANGRRAHLRGHLSELESGLPAHEVELARLCAGIARSRTSRHGDRWRPVP